MFVDDQVSASKISNLFFSTIGHNCKELELLTLQKCRGAFDYTQKNSKIGI
jgi:hypothetical protein